MRHLTWSAGCSGAVGRMPMRIQTSRSLCASVGLLVLTSTFAFVRAQQPAPVPTDAVAQAQQRTPAAGARPEQVKTEHDRSNVFDPPQAQPSSPVFTQQPKEGKNSGFDFVRDPLNSDRPSEDPDAIMKRLIADKPKVMAAHRALLAQRYILEAKLDPSVKMSRSKPLAMGPTARLANAMTWDRLAQMRPEDIKQQGVFPYPA